MLYYLCCKNKTCCLFSLQERHRRAAVFYFSEIAWPRAPVTTAEWMKHSAVTGSGALKKQVLLSFSCSFSFPHGSLKMIWAAAQRAVLTPVFCFPRKQHMLLITYSFYCLRKPTTKKAFCLQRHEVFLGRKCVAFFPLFNCSPPVLWTENLIHPHVVDWADETINERFDRLFVRPTRLILT